jgi:hypothetical protein
MPTRFATTLRSARAQAIVDAIDAGAAGGTVKFYDGTQPTAGAAITTETLGATLTFSATCGTVTTGVLTFAAVTADDSADASITPTWARIADSDGTFVMDVTVTGAGGGGAIEVTPSTFSVGGEVSITGGTITEGNA